MPDDDRLLVRPYVAPSGPLNGSSGPAWPEESGRILVPTRFGAPAEEPAPSRTPGADPKPEDRTAPSAPSSASSASSADRRGSRLPFVGLALLALGAAGALALLLRGPDREPPRAVVPPNLSVPVLPARSPGAGEETASAGESLSPPAPGAPSATAPSATGRPSSGPSPSTSRDPKPTGPTGPRPTPGGGTLGPGDRGAEVRALQERLHAQGFTYVSLTGVYDEQTRRGVTQLQQNRSINGDPLGVYGPATRAAFGIEG
ncbi:peptidoglycan-binding domain-containing protein [Streptomyces sp. ZAF1911]|uniref:peptidoglycan-binding domain-containing protein n=1 Tax=Streptomyces sp. ZAF1911 TaxID=2944129 RepID=UPI00237BF742|nr:peptidoglycan-binding domain-containing protein [Streptomyces sp. ZAF1911]MDD9376014.1 peptidoglycan-binding domain-containing protein [Streptomyces sp. ZAF1911]